MRWFASFFTTSVIVIVVTGLLWIRNNELFGTDALSDVLVWSIPSVLAFWIQRFQIPLIFAIWVFLRTAFQWTLDYVETQVEGAPRRDRALDRMSEWAFILFHNPARWWLAPYTALLTLVLGVIGAYIWVFDQNVITKSAWGLSMLFLSTLVATMTVSERPDRLRRPANADTEPDHRFSVASE